MAMKAEYSQSEWDFTEPLGDQAVSGPHKNDDGKDIPVQDSFAELFQEDMPVHDEGARHHLTFVDETPLRVVPVVYKSRRHAAVRTEEYLYSQLIPYIGNKRKLLWLISNALQRTGLTKGTFVDFFAGSSVVARLAKLLGYQVIANDWEPYSQVINKCYIGLNSPPEYNRLGGMQGAFDFLNGLPPIEGYIATHLCPRDDNNPDPDRERMFFTRANGGKIDAMREKIEEWDLAGLLTPNEKAVLLAAMVYSVSYVSNTSGVFKGFHRGWGGNTQTALYRILSDIELRPPVLYDNQQENEAYQLDAQLLAAQLREANQAFDVAYLDPPYNQHPYGSNYHVLNTVVLWDKPELSPTISGRDKSAIRLDWRTERRSAYNYSTALDAYELLIHTINARYILTSYSTDGNIPLLEMLQSAARRGAITCVAKPYKRYRVSTQRMSRKPMNVEFILMIDTQGKSTQTEAADLYEEIVRTEEEALSSHPELQGNSEGLLFGDT